VAELYEGVYNSDKQEQHQKDIEKLLSQFTALEVSIDICKTFAKERSRLRQEGQLIGDFDLMIASTALYYNLTVLTNNKKHFERIKGLTIISVDL
jgi:tRNA(fMet)-specific endonuclease VapC